MAEKSTSREQRLGVYVCHCGVNISHTVDVEKVAEMAAALPGVVLAKTYPYMCSDPGQNLICADIKEHGLTGVVVAACSPRMHEPTFRAALASVGVNPYMFEMANIREQCSWIHDDKEAGTEKAIDLVRSAVARAGYLEGLTEREIKVEPSTLIIGGGIAGIQAALDIAEAGFQVYLVEKDPSIGGRMAQLDKTFPTLDCSACILTPKMVDVSRHPNIDLMTYSNVEDISGYVGSFNVTIRKRARYVDVDECTACNDCVDVCPVAVPNEFDEGLATRKAIYQPFPQAVPAAYVLNMDECLGTNPIACGKCLEACDKKCINYDDKDELVEIEVGTIIVATGMDVFDATEIGALGYGRYDDILTSLEFERLVSAGGPTGGELIRVSDRKAPKSIVFLQCVGSRDKTVGNEYCSRVCCMYTAKQAHLVREKLPDADITVFYTDIRAFGKGFEEFYDRVRKENVIYRRGSVSEIYRRKDRLVVRGDDTLLGEPVEIEADMVVLAVGLVPRPETDDIAAFLKLSKSSDRFLMEAHPKLRPVDTAVEGVFVAGCCQGPKDIPDAVAQAKAAASSALIPMSRGTVRMEAISATVDEDMCSGCRICMSVCPYEAITYDENDKVCRVNEALCKGCGTCGAACPSGAMSTIHFTSGQMRAQVLALIGGSDD